MLIANTEQIRAADRNMIEGCNFPGLLLMETAGRKAAEFILETYLDMEGYLILTGPGNNGGDGLVIARYLHLAGKDVHVRTSHDPSRFKGDARANFRALEDSGVAIGKWNGHAVTGFPDDAERILIIDALLGTGVTGKVRGNIKEILEGFRDTPFPVVAIDLPSGLSADTGALINEPLRAAYTLTFQLPKIGHYVTPAADACGEVVTIDIGIWPAIIDGLGIRRQLMTGAQVRAWYAARPVSGHKGTFGHALLIGGSRRYAGAIALAAHAALHMGAGLSSVFAPSAVSAALFGIGPEVMLEGQDGNCLSKDHIKDAVRMLKKAPTLGVGPGMGTEEMTADFLRLLLLTADHPLVLDADALNLIAAHPNMWKDVPAGSILTPHPGEMKRLTGAKVKPAQRLAVAEEFAQKRKVVLVLKGAHTIIAAPDGSSFVNFSGNSGLATAGSGDVLTGAITGLLAQGYPPVQAAAMGVYLHGLAGDLAAEQSGREGVTAMRIMHSLSPALQVALQGAEPKPSHR